MSDKTTTPTADKKKRQVTPTQFALVAEVQKADGPPEFVQLPLPDGIDLSNPKHRSRSAIQAAVKSNLEDDKNVGFYSGKKLHVIELGPVFSFRVVEEIKKSVNAG